MNNNPIPVTVRIADKEYKISCPTGEHESLIASAQRVSEDMHRIRDGGKALGAERIAVMAALNIAHKLLIAEGTTNDIDFDILKRLETLQESVDFALKSY